MQQRPHRRVIRAHSPSRAQKSLSQRLLYLVCLTSQETTFEEMVASRIDKARAILRMRDQSVTIESRGRRLHEPQPVANARYQAERRVEYCDAHHVEITIYAEGVPAWSTAEALSSVEISADRQRTRYADPLPLKVRYPIKPSVTISSASFGVTTYAV